MIEMSLGVLLERVKSTAFSLLMLSLDMFQSNVSYFQPQKYLKEIKLLSNSLIE